MASKYLRDRREYPVTEVIEALAPMAQPELLETKEQASDVVLYRDERSVTRSVIAPLAKNQ